MKPACDRQLTFNVYGPAADAVLASRNVCVTRVCPGAHSDGNATFGGEARGFHAPPNTAKEFLACLQGRRFLAAREGDILSSVASRVSRLVNLSASVGGSVSCITGLQAPDLWKSRALESKPFSGCRSLVQVSASRVGSLGGSAMRKNVIATVVAFPALVLARGVLAGSILAGGVLAGGILAGGTTPAAAADKLEVKGLYLLTDYPAISVRPGTTSTISMRLQNYGLPPENFALSVDGAPAGWTATLLGGGQPVGAAMPATDQSVSLQLRLDVPADAGTAAKTLTVKAEGQGSGDGEAHKVSLPITINLAKELPAKLTLSPQLPSLRGTPKSSFDYTVSVKNDSGRNLTVSLAATAPRNFETSFTESYGSQELTSVPVDAGASKDIKLKVRPPSSVDAGTFPIEMTATSGDAAATAQLSLDVVGQPRLAISGPNDLVEAQADAGRQSTFPVVVTNLGSAAADDVELSGSGPGGWKIEFEKKTIDRIAPSQTAEVNARVTPTDKTLAGVYKATLRASSRGETASTDFYFKVATSTTWGMVGIGFIALSLAVMFGAVLRFGRR
jgi:uncharacterized membrane protein